MIGKETQLSENGTTSNEITHVEMDTHLRIFSLSAFEARGRRYVLKEPALCYRKFEQGYSIFECPEYKVEGYSQNPEEAFRDLNADFVCLYDGLAHEPDNALTLDAIKSRNQLLESVLRIETQEVSTAVSAPLIP